MSKTVTNVWDQIAGSWHQVRGEVRKQWGKLTDNDLEEIRGQREILAGKVQHYYGLTKQEANAQIDKWAERLKL
jgi:uncharacterized protein YjbJ (UPF0337 family)